jgi:hypothetical protein
MTGAAACCAVGSQTSHHLLALVEAQAVAAAEGTTLATVTAQVFAHREPERTAPLADHVKAFAFVEMLRRVMYMHVGAHRTHSLYAVREQGVQQHATDTSMTPARYNTDAQFRHRRTSSIDLQRRVVMPRPPGDDRYLA